MKAKDIRDKSVEELTKLQTDLATEIFKLRFQVTYKQTENPIKLRTVRRDLARVKTLLAEKMRTETKA